MGRLNWNDSWHGIDKVFHFSAGFGVSVTTAALVKLALSLLPALSLGLPVAWLVPALGLTAAAVIGMAKEIWDMSHPPHQPSFQDAAVTTIGGAVASVLVWVILL
jgi:uncharacterized protein YfiM (DUF2279 family)